MRTDFQQKVLGHIDIAPDAIEVIIGIAVTKMAEVVGIQGSVTELFSKQPATRGIHLKRDNAGHFSVDVHVILQYGVSVPKVAKKIQERIQEQVLFMCDIHIDEVNVHVTQLVSEAGGTVG